MRRNCSLMSKSQHCVTVLLMLCDSLALGRSLQTQTHVEEKHQDSGTPSPSEFDENNLEARPPIKRWAPALPSPQLFNLTWTFILQAGALCQEDASWLTCFHLGKERWEVVRRRSTFGSCWVEHGNCQQHLALSHITPPCRVPPTGCTEKLTGLVAASHA